MASVEDKINGKNHWDLIDRMTKTFDSLPEEEEISPIYPRGYVLPLGSAVHHSMGPGVALC